MYGLMENGTLVALNSKTGDSILNFKMTEKEPLGLLHHPFANALVSFDASGQVKIYRA